jgi:signal transduction histidine kinase
MVPARSGHRHEHADAVVSQRAAGDEHLDFARAAVFFGSATFVMPLYLAVLARACLLLHGQPLYIVGGLCLVVQVLINSFKVKLPQMAAAAEPAAQLAVMLACGFILNIGTFALMLVVTGLVASLVSEQRLREKSEQLSREVESLAKELERTRIARELHDTLGHSLTSLKLQLEVARRFACDDSRRSHAALETAEELAARSLSDVRVALNAIRKDDFDFRQAVDALVQEAQSTGALVVLTDLPAAPLPRDVAYQIYRVIQECLTNTIKHADAAHVRIHATTGDGTLRLVFEDDGKGIGGGGSGGKGGNGERKPDSYGLKGMQERIDGLKGKLVVASRESGGTAVTVEVPL